VLYLALVIVGTVFIGCEHLISVIYWQSPAEVYKITFCQQGWKKS